MKKVLLLGGNGYIGNRIIEDYLNVYEITSVDTCWFNSPIVPTIEQDYNYLPPQFFSNFDVVILLAAHSSVKMCEGSVSSAFNNNVTNFINLLSKLHPKQKLIYASSSSVYGDVGMDTVTESYNDFVPHNHYDITKHINDLYAPRFDVEYYGLRFGTVNGYSPIVRNDVMINSMVYNGKVNGEIKLYIKDIIRPILGIGDLSRAIKIIIDSDKDNRGIYNLASFNSTAEFIANGVSKVINIPVIEYKTDPTNITNAKLQTKCYNFSIDCSKFIKTFQFEFKETVESITEELVKNFSSTIFTTRNEFKQYEQRIPNNPY
jgi:nucleoside-diphosphate-sugar epimerase